jgi:mannose-1-phosphate guanylyltransferase
MYALIMAGGSGTRLWPLSRQHRPKQFLQVGGARSLLQATVDRILPLVPPKRVLVVTGAAYAGLVREQLPELPSENVLLEPFGRSTGPCVGLGALYIARRDPEAVMAVLSADHRIEREETLRAALALGARVAREGRIVALGMPPDAPHPGYGYIRVGAPLAEEGGLEARAIDVFVEKPGQARAAQLLAEGGWLWNAGMFVMRADALLEELAAHQPALHAALESIAPALGTPEEGDAIAHAWEAMPTLAIDVAVMERTRRGAVIPVELGRGDVGDWASLAATLTADAQGNRVVGQHVGIDTTGCVVYGGERLIATVGLSDLVIVDAGDVLLVCPRDRAQEVKQLVALARERLGEGIG